MEDKHFIHAKNSTKSIKGIPLLVTEVDHGFLISIRNEIEDIHALMQSARLSADQDTFNNVSCALNGICRLTGDVINKLNSLVDIDDAESNRLSG